MTSKQYGLIKSTKGGALLQNTQKPSVFGDDSDSNDESSRPTGLKTAPKRQDRLLQEKAMEEDPTVYQYDEIYDEMDKKRTESKLSRKDLDKKPKYISRLLQTAERRKRENERRIERQVQKEREAEGEMYKDKESFVTSAYRQKLEEMRQLEEQEKREEYLETIGDVTKQGNLDGFYRHLYDQKVLFEDKINEESQNGEENKTKQGEVSVKKEVNSEEDENTQIEAKSNIKKRKYRKHEESESDDEKVETKLEHLPSNLDADSDFSIDSSDSEEEKDDNKPKEQDHIEKSSCNLPSSPQASEDVKSQETKQEDSENKNEQNDVNEVEEPKPKKPKIDIWKKRTVGEVFENAVKRYFERKAQREAGIYSRF